jgi:hypothetical protein
MTIKIIKTESVETEIQVPAFFRDSNERNFIGVLDEKTVVTIYSSDELTIVKNTTPQFASRDIAEAYNEFYSCTEAEFLEKYESVIHSISLHPKLAI